MSKVKQQIPVVDLGEVGLSHQKDPSEEEWHRVAKGITDAFKSIGFVYLTNHGIPEEVINNVFEASATFFDLPKEEKDRYSINDDRVHGYVAIDREKLDTSRHELREAYDIRSAKHFFPDKSVPSFRPSSEEYLNACQNLSRRLFAALAIGLGLERNFFVDNHQRLGKEGNSSFGRVLHYPPVPKEISQDSIRCGAHTDYGTLTLLFQDDMGGLRVKDCHGQWVSAGNLPGAVMVNIGDLMQFWTAEKLVATEHKVIVPVEEARQQKSRRSLVYFLHPDDDHLVKPLDGSNRFQPITGLEYLKKRFNETYAY